METATPSATQAQSAAIAARGGDVCVSAGAGSGKTYVLVERFMGLVREGIDPGRLLTITFTEKAARVMSDRIARALEADGYAEARRVADSAWISTIHGFCARLLREKALEAGVDPVFTVLTNVPAARVRRDAFLRAQRSFRTAHPGLYDALVERVRWGKNQDGVSEIRRQVFQLYDSIRAAGVTLRPLGADPVSIDSIQLPRVQVACERLTEAVRWLMSAVAGVSRRSSFMERRAAALSEVFGRISAQPLDVFRPSFHRDLRSLAELASCGGALRDAFQAVRNAANDAAAAYAEGPAQALGRGLEDLLQRFDVAFRELKTELSALDFTDLEERTRDLLVARSDVREEVQRRFVEVLVDEFQDTARLQQQIVDLVRRPGGLFAVGDVKQSIYGFRHADVSGLLDLHRRCGEAPDDHAVTLDLSFRTRPEILAYIDEVFERLFDGDGSHSVPHQTLRTELPFASTQRPAVELVLGRGDSLRQARVQEAKSVAARLATLIEGGQLVGTNPLREETFERPLRYRDAAILLPATTALPAYERALRERGIPYRVSSGRGFYKAREVIDAVTLLEVVAAADTDLEMLAFLRSTAVGLSDGALLTLARIRGRRSFYWALEESVRTKALIGVDSARAREALELVHELRELRGRVSTRELLAHGLERSGLLDGSLLRSGDVRGFANLQKLLAVVEDLEREGVTGPAAIAQVLGDLRASDARESEANVASDEEDAVAVLTVHASKGLEWPLVVVADLGRYRRPDNDPVMWSRETGVTLNLRDVDGPDAITPTSLRRLADLRRERAREESKRLLYVALTRTQDHLILAGARRNGARSGGDWLTWCRAVMAPNEPHLGVEQDVAGGGLARAYPTRGGVAVRTLEVDLDLDARVEGVLGPDVGVQPPLDPRACRALAHGQRPVLRLPPQAIQARATTLLERVERPNLPPLDHGASVYTVSEVVTWRTCPRRALYQHVIGDQSPWEPEVVGASRGTDDDGVVPGDLRGTLAHEVLAWMHDPQRGRPTLRQVEARLGQLLAEAGRGVSSAVQEQTSRWILHMARRFQGSWLGRLAQEGGAETRSELPFLVATESPDPVLLRGTVDLLVPGQQSWILADYKATDITALEVPTRRAPHDLQLRLYALGLRQLGIPVESAWVVYLVPEVITEVDLATNESIEDTLRDYTRARRELDLPARPGTACRHCPWMTACPAATPLPSALPALEPTRALPTAG